MTSVWKAITELAEATLTMFLTFGLWGAALAFAFRVAKYVAGYGWD